MAKPNLGSKRQCLNCGTKFFDLGKDPIICPKCGTVFQVAAALAARGGGRAAPADDDEVDAEASPEVVPLEDADAVEDGKVTVAVVEDDTEAEDDTPADDDTFLEEEEEDDGDVSDLIDGEIEDDEER